MPKLKPPDLSLEALGNLAHYEDDELFTIREKLIADSTRIHEESAQLARRIKDLNRARHELAQDYAERGRALRAIKNEQHTRNRQQPHTTLVARGRGRGR